MKAVRMKAALFFVALVVCIALGVHAVDKSKFRECKDTAFCRLNRNDVHASKSGLQWSVVSVEAGDSVKCMLQNRQFPQQDPLVLTLAVVQNDVVHMTVKEQEEKELKHHSFGPRWSVIDVVESAAMKLAPISYTKAEGSFVVSFGATKQYKLTVTESPFLLTIGKGDAVIFSANARGLFNFEALREKNPKPAEVAAAPEGEASKEGEAAGEAAVVEAAVVEAAAPVPVQLHRYDKDGDWSEGWGGKTDNKNRGPQSIGLDVSFHNSQHVFGIPEHATDFSLKDTRASSAAGAYSEPYRLFNLDVFEYDLDSPMALYGAVPLLVSHSADVTAGFLWLNAAETYIDITSVPADEKDGKPRKDAHWMSESGVMEGFFFMGPTPARFFQQWGSLTGMPALPQRFAIGYHQCRWNYKNEEDVAAVDAGFDNYDIPYDVLWLDIEHTDGKRYFTWDKTAFPTPKEMQAKLAAKGRKMVTIVDPHIKIDSHYQTYQDASDKQLYVQSSLTDSSAFKGWCWPGDSSYLDFIRPEVRKYWASLFTLENYVGSTSSLYTWNDMNEPSVFSGPEVTMPKDAIHQHGGSKVEHRDVHNMYGSYHQQATAEGHLERGLKADPVNGDRPFVLTRSFFAGSQKYGAVWTGDNMAQWSHLEAAAPMLLSMAVGGIVFSGADVGGFFGNPDAELLTRWYQAAAFQPFFRGHAHVETKRREPWVFGEPTTSHIRAAIRTRYTYLPYLYSLFQHASVTAMPIMRPLWIEFPADPEVFSMQNQFLLGDAIMVSPVTKAGMLQTEVYMPGQQGWYDVQSYTKYTVNRATMETPLEKISVLQRGGTVVAKRERARRNSALMENDPYTLVVALSPEGEAQGSLYVDDGQSFAFQKQGQSCSIQFALSAQATKLSNTAVCGGGYTNANMVERLVLMGLNKTLVGVSVSGRALTFTQTTGEAAVVVVRKPDLPITGNWVVEFKY